MPLPAPVPRRGRLFRPLLGLLLLIVAPMACNEVSSPLQLQAPPGPEIDLDTLATRIATALDSSTYGYAYVVSQNGQMARSGAAGWARGPSEGGVSQSIDRTMIVFSLSKLLTTVAALQLIEAQDLTVDSLIGRWLPPEWNAPASVRNLRFRELLSHRSGVRSTLQNAAVTQSWEGMRDSLANGTPLPKTYTYQNLNFAVFQAMIPKMWAGLPNGPTADHQVTATSASFWYRQYVVSQILEPIGISNTDCVDDRATTTLFYRLETGISALPDDRTMHCASGGWYLSPREFARFMAYLRHTEDLLTTEQRATMDDLGLGWDGPNHSSGAHGTYPRKNGSRSTGTGGPGGLTQVMVFPATGVEVVVFTNSRSNNEWNLGTLVRGAYEAAVVN
jgi:D-alanyl-D-alanine carboxypeptidase